MSCYTIKNDWLEVKIDSHGAEIKSIQANGKEYMWNGDPVFWGRTSPVLFPIVGSLCNKQFVRKGDPYAMGQHGFARDTEFELVTRNSDYIAFRLSWSHETYSKYPYAFELEIAYALEGAGVKVIWKVKNPSREETLDFSIGAHPAFLCKQEGYAFHIYRREKAKAAADTDGKLVPIETLAYQKLTGQGTLKRAYIAHELPTAGVLPINQALFLEDALIIDQPGIQRVALADETGEEYLSVDFTAPLVGLWSPAGKNAPFVCIEPWYGRCDAEDFEGDFSEREYGNHVLAQESFVAEYKINILK